MPLDEHALRVDLVDLLTRVRRVEARLLRLIDDLPRAPVSYVVVVQRVEPRTLPQRKDI